jgi:hypothetical protein
VLDEDEEDELDYELDDELDELDAAFCSALAVRRATLAASFKC